MDGAGFEIRWGERHLLLSSRPIPRPICPQVQWSPILFQKVKWPGHAVGHRPPSSIVVKNIWSCTSTHLPPVACYLTTFTFILYFKFCNKHYDSHLLGKRRKKGKAIPVQACTGPEGSRRLRLPDFKTIGT